MLTTFDEVSAFEHVYSVLHSPKVPKRGHRAAQEARQAYTCFGRAYDSLQFALPNGLTAANLAINTLLQL